MSYQSYLQQDATFAMFIYFKQGIEREMYCDKTTEEIVRRIIDAFISTKCKAPSYVLLDSMYNKLK